MSYRYPMMLASVAIAAATFAAEYTWTGQGTAGDWTSVGNWSPGSGYPSGGDTAIVGSDIVITTDFEIGEGTLDIQATGSIDFNCVISGAGMLSKKGAGELYLRRNNTFKGGFYAEGSHSTDPSSYYEGNVHVYAPTALGISKAQVEAAGGNYRKSKLCIYGPLTVSTPMQLGDGWGNRTILQTYGDVIFGASLTFKNRFTITTDGAGSTVELRNAPTVKGNCYITVGVGDTLHFVTSALSVGQTIWLSDDDVRGRVVFDKIESNKLLSLSRNGGFVMGGENALYSGQYTTFRFKSNSGVLDLNGYDQTITVTNAAWAEYINTASPAYGFKSDRYARLVFSGDCDDLGFRGRFYGRAGFKWNPSDPARVFSFTNTVQDTSGELEVANGKVVVAEGAGFSSLAKVTVAEGAALEIGTGLQVVAGSARFGSMDLPIGAYTRFDDIPGLSGDGTLVITGYSDADNTWQGGSSGSWNDPGNWSYGSVPGAGERAVVKEGKVTVSSSIEELATLFVLNGATMEIAASDVTIATTNLFLMGGGRITVDAADQATPKALHVVCDELLVDSESAIDMDGKGFACHDYAANVEHNGYGPGKGTACNGASHGGLGGHQVDRSASAPPTYDDPEHPAMAGSSGFKGKYANSGCNGGGVIRLEVTGLATINGRVSANGESSCCAGKTGSWNDTAGAGGAVWITCGAIAGKGSVTAKGGNGDRATYTPEIESFKNGFGMPGGGGMIAIHYDGARQRETYAELEVSAACGYYTGTENPVTLKDQDRYFTQAELGSVWFTDAALLENLLGNGLSGRIVNPCGYATDYDLIISSGHVRLEGEGVRLAVGGDLMISGAGARLEVGGVSLTNRTVRNEVYAGSEMVRVEVAGGISVTDNARFDIRSAAGETDGGFGALVTVGANMFVDGNSRIVPWCDAVKCTAPEFRVVGSCYIGEGSMVDARCRGGAGAANSSAYNGYEYKSAYGNGRGRGAYYAAASYGGLGGRGSSVHDGAVGTGSSSVYGSFCYPNDCGSGGGSAGYVAGGFGGGLVKIFAGGAITVDGEIDADGGYPQGINKRRLNYHQSGSGGGVYLSAATFGGSGSIHANGGASRHQWVTEDQVEYEAQCGAGGGGRIAIWTGGAPQESIANAQSVRIARSDTPSLPGMEQFSGTVTAAAGAEVFGCDEDARPPLENTAGQPGTVNFFHFAPPSPAMLLLR